jgi:acyl carrier protein
MSTEAAITTSRLIAQISEICGVPPSALSRETLVDEIGLTSLSLPLILNALENEFGIEFDEDEVATFLGARSIGIYADVLDGAVNR